MLEKTNDLIDGNPASPAAFVYMSDGWSTRVQSRFTKITKDEHLVVRGGRYKHEFLLQRGLVKKKSRRLGPETVMLFGYPRGLCKGRGAWNCFTASAEFRDQLRLMGATGIAIECTVCDGALFSALTRHIDASHRMYCDPELGADLGEDRETLEDKEWPVNIKCKAHGCSNAVVHGLKPLPTAEKSTMAQNAIRSLRVSSEGFFYDIDLYLYAHVVFQDSTDNPAHVWAYWEFLGVQENWVPHFVEANPMFDGTNLVVDSRLRADPDATEKLSGLVHYALHQADWSETRWVKVRQSSGCHMQSESVGVKVLVRRLLNNPDLVNSYLSGYDKNLTVDVRMYLVVASFVATPPEAILFSLLKDNRLLKKVPEMKFLLEFKAQYIWDLPDLVFTRS